MSSLFDEKGKNVPCTVLELGPCVVTQVKTIDNDGYEAVQLGFDDKPDKKVNKSISGHFNKAKVDPKKKLAEFKMNFEEDLKLGDTITVEHFKEGEFVDISAISKGKGFQGVYRKYNFGGLPQSHGSMMHRRTGSIGAGSTPGRVWKNTKMPGRMGGKKVTVQNLKVIQSRPEDNVLLISGTVPGAKGGYVIIRPAIKK